MWGPYSAPWLGLVLWGIATAGAVENCEGNASTAASMLQSRRHFEASKYRSQEGLTDRPPVSSVNFSFEKELNNLYLQQVALQRSLTHQDPDAGDDSLSFGLPNLSDAVSAAGEGTVDAIGNLTNMTEETKAEIQNFWSNHSTDKMMVYWFGPSAAWACVNSSVFSDQDCGYFGGWLSWQALTCILLVPTVSLGVYVYFILDLVMIDTDDPDFDDEEFRRQHGWSLVQHQWELKYVLGSFALPIELIIFWQLGLLQVLLQALEPYFVAALIICTGLAPVLLSTYLQISRRINRICKRFTAVEQTLEILSKHLLGDLQAVKDAVTSGFNALSPTAPATAPATAPGTPGTATGTRWL